MPRKKANYPDWVLKYKKKGTYINRVGDKYYLYAAHSERIKGTDKVRRVSDGYLGRITEKDGLIPARSQVRKAPLSYEAGLSFAIVSVTKDISLGLNKVYRRNGNLIYSCAILSFIYGEHSEHLFRNSYLGLHFAETSYPASFTQSQMTGIERGLRMLNEVLPKIFTEDMPRVLAFFPDIRLIKVNSDIYLSGTSPQTSELSEKYNIIWEDPLWQK